MGGMVGYMVTATRRIVDALAKGLHGGYEASRISGGKLAPSRTSTNREWLIQNFLVSVLPVSVHVRLGANLVDVLDQESGDVDVAVLNPWAAPVWPHQHGTVPVEGVLAAVLVESTWRSGVVGEQAARTKALLKSLQGTEGYCPIRRRTFRPVVGIWCWERPPRSEAVVRQLMRSKGLSGWFRESVKRARAANWRGPQPNGEVDEMANGFAQYQWAVGSALPNWVYFHAREERERLLLLKRARYDEWLNSKWRASRSPAGDSFVGPVESWKRTGAMPSITAQFAWTRNGSRWAYEQVRGPDGLPILVGEILDDAMAYGRERPAYRGYFGA